MIISKTSSPTIVSFFRWLRRGEIAVRQVVLSVVLVLPLNDDTKQQWTTRIRRNSEDAQIIALQSARAGLHGTHTTTPEAPARDDVPTFMVDAFFQPRVASHSVSIVLVCTILLFGSTIIEKGGLTNRDRGTVAQKTAIEIAPPIDAPLPQVMSALELTVPQMVTPLPSAAPPFLFYHRIQVADTLGKIAEIYNINPKVLFWANGLQNGRVFIVNNNKKKLPCLSSD
ncbi:MAG: hypothetical protein ACKO83_11415 [Roseiflexaceae bacterium]